jgi:hypothetical protein
MAINPNIALAVRGIELQDPLVQYGRVSAIQQAQQQNQLAQMQMQQSQRDLATTNALNQAYKEAYSPDTGEVDINRLRGSLATGGYGSKLPEVEEKFFKAKKEKSAFVEQENKAFDSSMGLIRNAWGNVRTIEDALAVHDATHRDPIINKRLADMGVTEQMGRQTIMEAAKDPVAFADFLKRAQLGAQKFIEMNKPSTQVIDRSGQKDVIQIPGLGGDPTTVGTYADVPLPEDVVAQKTRIAKAGSTTVNVSTERAYGGEVAKLAAQQDIELANQASTLPRNAAKIDEALDLLYNADINTGLGAEVFTVLDKARSKFAADKAAGERVEGTEYLDTLLGSDVFPQISALGIGARGLDTPAEREFLRNVITGTIKLDRSTLIRMTEFRRKALENAAKVYNEKVESGALDKYFEYTGRPKAKIEIPKAPTRTQAPMYATNPQTGARIVSTDGGNTWRPAGQ